MNYLGAEPTRYQLEIHNFFKNMSFLVSVPLPPQGFLRKKGAMGDDHLCFIINIWSVYNSDSHPPALPTAVGITSPFPQRDHFVERGTFIFFEAVQKGAFDL